MSPSFLGIPYTIWGIICLLLALIWVFVWPKNRVAAGTLRHLILRWFHALEWLLLSLGAFLTGFDVLGGHCDWPPCLPTSSSWESSPPPNASTENDTHSLDASLIPLPRQVQDLPFDHVIKAQ